MKQELPYRANVGRRRGPRGDARARRRAGLWLLAKAKLGIVKVKDDEELLHEVLGEKVRGTVADAQLGEAVGAVQGKRHQAASWQGKLSDGPDANRQVRQALGARVLVLVPGAVPCRAGHLREVVVGQQSGHAGAASACIEDDGPAVDDEGVVHDEAREFCDPFTAAGRRDVEGCIGQGACKFGRVDVSKFELTRIGRIVESDGEDAG